MKMIHPTDNELFCSSFVLYEQCPPEFHAMILLTIGKRHSLAIDNLSHMLANECPEMGGYPSEIHSRASG